MNDELKATLEWLKTCGENDYIFETGNSTMLLDYTTNLQQENERLETNLGELQNAIDNIGELLDVPEGMSVEDVYDKVKDYKSRIEKTIEFINEYCKYNKININGNKYYDEFILNNVIDMLRGEDNE